MKPSERIDRLIAELDDWRGKTFARLRKTILAADREITEEWKWMGSPVWYRDGMIAVANAHQGKVKLTFAHGARLADPDQLFNAGLEGNARRAIDFLEGDAIDERALKTLIRAAIAFNQTRAKKAPSSKRATSGSKASSIAKAAPKPPAASKTKSPSRTKSAAGKNASARSSARARKKD